MCMLEGRRVLITGAGGGIGHAKVEAFATAGVQVVACDRTAELLAGVAVAEQEVFDLADPAACRASLERIEAAGGLPDIVVSNAEHTRAETFAQVDDAVWRQELDVNRTHALGAAL